MRGMPSVTLSHTRASTAPLVRMRLLELSLILFLAALASCVRGAPLPLGIDHGSWELTVQEEFDGAVLNRSLWYPQVSVTSSFYMGEGEGICCFVDTPNNIALHDGFLHLTVREEAQASVCGKHTTKFTSGMISTFQRFNQAYGVFEVRAKLPNVVVPGVQETFWLWPENQTRYGVVHPASGEIDFAEFYSQYSDLVVPYLHYLDKSPLTAKVTAYDCKINISDFNTYSVEWNTTTITIYYNGKICFYNQNWDPRAPLVAPQPFSQPFFIALTQALGVGANRYNATNTPLPATTMVDYVRIWKAADPSSETTTTTTATTATTAAEVTTATTEATTATTAAEVTTATTAAEVTTATTSTTEVTTVTDAITASTSTTTAAATATDTTASTTTTATTATTETSTASSAEDSTTTTTGTSSATVLTTASSLALLTILILVVL